MRRSVFALFPVLILFLESTSFASSIRYGYYRFSANYEYYTGLRTSGANLNVHDFQFADSSGELGAALQTAGNRVAAQAGAENKEREAVRKGESLGGPKTLTYEYEQAEAKPSEGKVYGLRLGSTDDPFNFEPIFGNTKKDKLITHVEISLVASLFGDTLYSSDLFSLAWTGVFGVRWGGVRQNDFSAGNGDQFRDAGYFYLPTTVRLHAKTFIPLTLMLEAGLDPITLVRQHALDVDMPLDRFVAAAVDYRFGVIAVGLHHERYMGSIITTPDSNKRVKVPVYEQQMTGAFVMLGF